MSFKLCNASNTFQFFINATLREYLNNFCTIYLNDILIYSNNRENHIKHVNKISEKFQKIEFFFDINKCEFFIIEMKYLNFIITIENIKINSIKIDVVINWKTFRCFKNVQVFLKFANFYRKFIFDYSRIIISLIRLTRIIDTSTIFSWNFDNFEKNAFQILKLTFIIVFILIHFDFDKKTWIEIDVSNYVVIAILSQKKRSVTFRRVHVKKNFIREVQLRNLWQKAIDYYRNIWKMKIKMCWYVNEKFDSNIHRLQKFRAFYDNQTTKSSSSSLNWISVEIQLSDNLSLWCSKHQI